MNECLETVLTPVAGLWLFITVCIYLFRFIVMRFSGRGEGSKKKESLETGNSGDRLGCGVIALAAAK